MSHGIVGRDKAKPSGSSPTALLFVFLDCHTTFLGGIPPAFREAAGAVTQFLPSSYIKYGVDFDGDGRVDLRHSVPDVLTDRQSVEGKWLARRRAVRPRHGEFRGGDARVESLRDLLQDHRADGAAAGRRVRVRASPTR